MVIWLLYMSRMVAVTQNRAHLTSFRDVFADGNLCSSTSSKFVSKLSPALLFTRRITQIHVTAIGQIITGLDDIGFVPAMLDISSDKCHQWQLAKFSGDQIRIILRCCLCGYAYSKVKSVPSLIGL